MSLDKDDLTGLPNRIALVHALRQQVALANERQSQLALVVIDIEGFAQINIANGYAAGDAVLRHVAQQVQAVARPQDFAARVGADRFALLLPRVFNHGHVELAMQKLARLLQVPFHPNGTRIAIQVTAGAALCPEHATHAEYLLRKAETALATARGSGKRYLFAPNVVHGLDLSELWELEMALDSAIDRGELKMHYQPQVAVGDRRPIGAEALMRWERKGGDVIPPDVFIPLAERTGQIKKVTIWALNTVLRQAGDWPADRGRLTVSVNLPGELAVQRDLPELVENALNLWGRDHLQLVLEITERSLMDRDHGVEILRRLRGMGVQISIDDFGTGYSCLAYFKNIPADELKVDKSFVTGLLTDSASLDITTLVIDLAHRFDLRVVAEGVESADAFELLKARGADIAQGYLFGHPMPPDRFREWLLGCGGAVPMASV